MLDKTTSSLIICGILLLMLMRPVHATGSLAVKTVSPNIPLDSYIYTCLDKLDGLGYLGAMRPSTKPYSRMRAAQWVEQMLEDSATLAEVPDYVQAMLERLRGEFNRELTALAAGHPTAGIYRIEAIGEASYYDGPTLTQHPETLKSSYQPLNINNNGYKLSEGLNNVLTLHWEGMVDDRFAFGVTPRFSYDDPNDYSASLASGYLKTRIGNLGIQLGKEEQWWGPGERGNLTLTNNMTPLTALRLSTLEPVRLQGILKFLKQMDGTFYYSKLEENREVPGPSFVGLRTTFIPTADFTCGAAFNSMLGGKGHHLSGRDYWEFLTGKNAATSTGDKWNSLAGLDFRWRLPQWGGVRIYGEYYGEDQAGKVLPLPSRNAYLFGIDLPRLTVDGRWDLTFEKAFTTNWWYQHWLYTDGYTYRDNLIGDAMGYNASRYDLKLSRYFRWGAVLSLNAELATLDRDADYPQRVKAFWLGYHRNLRPGLAFKVTVGTARLQNVGYQAGQKETNYLLSLGLTKQF